MPCKSIKRVVGRPRPSKQEISMEGSVTVGTQEMRLTRIATFVKSSCIYVPYCIFVAPYIQIGFVCERVQMTWWLRRKRGESEFAGNGKRGASHSLKRCRPLSTTRFKSEADFILRRSTQFLAIHLALLLPPWPRIQKSDGLKGAQRQRRRR